MYYINTFWLITTLHLSCRFQVFWKTWRLAKSWTRRLSARHEMVCAWIGRARRPIPENPWSRVKWNYCFAQKDTGHPWTKELMILPPCSCALTSGMCVLMSWKKWKGKCVLKSCTLQVNTRNRGQTCWFALNSLLSASIDVVKTNYFGQSQE